MEHNEVSRYWDANAEAWTLLARAGYDVYRDYLNTPGFLAMLPDVAGLSGLDIGCGEGSNTLRLAAAGARMVALDIVPRFIRHALRADGSDAARYCVANAVKLPFPDDAFDFATAFMSLMDMPEQHEALAEAYRVIRPGGFLQFSITHPCFDTPHRRNLRGPDGRTYALEVGDYFRYLDGEISEWIFSAAPADLRGSLQDFRISQFNRTVSQWLNMLIDAGFAIERVGEPRPSDETVQACPAMQDAQVVAFFLHIRARKPRTGAS